LITYDHIYLKIDSFKKFCIELWQRGERYDTIEIEIIINKLYTTTYTPDFKIIKSLEHSSKTSSGAAISKGISKISSGAAISKGISKISSGAAISKGISDVPPLIGDDEFEDFQLYIDSNYIGDTVTNRILRCRIKPIPIGSRIHIARGNGLCLFNAIYYGLFKMYVDNLRIIKEMKEGAQLYARSEGDSNATVAIDVRGNHRILGPKEIEEGASNAAVAIDGGDDYRILGQKEIKSYLTEHQHDSNQPFSLCVFLAWKYNINIICLLGFESPEFRYFNTYTPRVIGNRTIFLINCGGGHFNLLEIPPHEELNFIETLMRLYDRIHHLELKPIYDKMKERLRLQKLGKK
jgi:hypothetical protein